MGASIVSTFTDALSGVATGIANTVVDVFNAVCVTAEGEISNIAIWGLVFGGIALAAGIVRKFTSKVG